ncbi:prepilin peptidase [Phycicoccus flavus]|uniref:prepilin peptidase n=1 Tax=Phycicoccus flavus TaxID=2502783 RepID=UPI000FEBF729|nr:A24 family peptidase [Phycicoccus flavus]NHA69468.1 prepilin peptidase [Phycicoccus flavus]
MGAPLLGLRLMVWLLLAGGVAAGLAAGALLTRHLRGRTYRYDDETDLPLRGTRWVLPVTALTLGLVAAGQVPPHPALGVLLSLAVPVLVGLSAIDLDTRRLPDRWTYPAAGVALVGLGVVALVDGSVRPLVAGVVGGVALGAFYLLNVVLGAFVGSGEGMGLGDAKLGVVLGLLLAPLSVAHVVVATVLAFLSAGAQALVMLARRRAGRGSSLAFGPHMALGAGVVLAAPGTLAVLRGGA